MHVHSFLPVILQSLIMELQVLKEMELNKTYAIYTVEHDSKTENVPTEKADFDATLSFLDSY